MSYKSDFDTTNKISKYEALVLGLQVAKNLKIEFLIVFGEFWIDYKTNYESMPN